jgi:two-component system chemotaxis response regulator CheB
MLDSSPLIEVVGWAGDGQHAFRRTLELEPDLITLDLEMPRMNGFTFLRLLMAKRPTPVLVISGRARGHDVFHALELGAVDFVAKPSMRATHELQSIEDGLIRKVHAMRELRIDKLSERVLAPPPVVATTAAPGADAVPTIVVGCSTGGPAALMQTLGAFAEVVPAAFLVAQHMPVGFTQGLAERLNRLTPFRVLEAREGEEPRAGTVLIAPGGCHLELEATHGRIMTRLEPDEVSDRFVPSVDRLFASAAKQFGGNLLAVVLTGMGDDGREGARQVKAAGGRVIAESEETAVIYGMPRQVVNAGLADQVIPLHEIPAAIQTGVEHFRTRMSGGRGRT